MLKSLVRAVEDRLSPQKTMKRLSALHIDQPYIALFGSGNSVNALSPQAFEYIKSKAFVITINYAPIRMNGHLNMWSDRKVSDFLNRHYQSNPKDCLLLAKENRLSGSLASSGTHRRR